MNTRLLVLVLLTAQSLGCASTKYYGVDYALQKKSVLSDAAQSPAPSAVDAMAGATTVAFFPPDACRDEKAAGAGSTEVSNVLRLTCGVLMSELEAEAGRAGFQVVSWQTLRGTKRPIDYAMENRVDILFEINELSLDIPPQELYAFSDIRFFERKTDSALAGIGMQFPWENPRMSAQKTPVVVADVASMGARCQQRFYGGLSSTVAVTLDVKMVSVKDGRVHWHYRTTKAEDKDTAAVLTRTWADAGGDGGGLTMLILSPIMLVGGGIATYIGVQQGFPDNDAALFPGVLGLTSLIGGGILGIVGATSVAPTYASPESVLCGSQRALEEATTDMPQQPQSGSSYQGTSQVTISNPIEARRKALLQHAIREFVDKVNGLKAKAPAVAPTPAPAPAATGG
jgi:hypothetical protein